MTATVPDPPGNVIFQMDTKAGGSTAPVLLTGLCYGSTTGNALFRAGEGRHSRGFPSAGSRRRAVQEGLAPGRPG